MLLQRFPNMSETVEEVTENQVRLRLEERFQVFLRTRLSYCDNPTVTVNRSAEVVPHELPTLLALGGITVRLKKDN